MCESNNLSSSVVMDILHCITGLNVGGAETSLFRLIKDTLHINHRVVFLYGNGPVAERLREIGISVKALNWSRGTIPTPHQRLEFLSEIASSHCNILHAWLYHACLASSWGVKRLHLSHPVIWSIRSSPSPCHSWSTWLVRKILGHGPWNPAKVVFNSQRSMQMHHQDGFSRFDNVYIPNGFNLDMFKPNPSAGQAFRRTLGLPDNALVVAWIGRNHPDKNPEFMLDAFAKIADFHKLVHLVCVGSNMIWSQTNLANAAAKNRLSRSQVHLLGHMDEVPSLLAAAHVLCLTSRSEAFPNVVAEAMACGVPCVVTDVGDAAEIVGNTGVIISSFDAHEYSQGILGLLTESPVARMTRCMTARQRIEEHFSMQQAAAQYETLYRSLSGFEQLGKGI